MPMISQEYDRGFYFEYESKVPESLVKTEEELLAGNHRSGKEYSKREAFVQMEYGRADVYDTNDAETVEANRVVHG